MRGIAIADCHSHRGGTPPCDVVCYHRSDFRSLVSGPTKHGGLPNRHQTRSLSRDTPVDLSPQHPIFLLKICGIVHLNLCYCSDLESCPSDLSSKSVPSKNGNRPSFLKRKKREKKNREKNPRRLNGRPAARCLRQKLSMGKGRLFVSRREGLPVCVQRPM